jgi:hypothetical protein
MFRMSELKHSYIDNEIARAVFQLQKHEVDSREYGTILDRVETMHKLREDEKPKHPSPDTILTIAANFAITIMIIRHEELNAITSKALSFVRFR